MKLNETSMPEMFSKGLFEEYSKDVAPQHTDKCCDILFNGATMVLGAAKSKDHPVAFTINKLDDSVIVAGIIRYFPSKDKNNPGSWNIAWTFNAEDIPEDAQIIKLKDAQTHSYFRGYAGEKYGMQFKDEGNLITTLTYVPTTIKKWLNENAKESEEISIEQDGVWKARVAVENGEKVFAIEVTGETTAKAKEDIALENSAA